VNITERRKGQQFLPLSDCDCLTHRTQVRPTFFCPSNIPEPAAAVTPSPTRGECHCVFTGEESRLPRDRLATVFKTKHYPIISFYPGDSRTQLLARVSEGGDRAAGLTPLLDVGSAASCRPAFARACP
jgi:hypothetical protein